METYKLILLFTYLGILFLNYYLDYLNIRHVKKNIDLIPPEFKGHIDEELLEKSQNYLIDNTKFDFAASVFNNVLFLVFIFGGILNWYNSWIMSLNLSFIVSGIVFFLLLTYAETFFTLPLSLYQTFRIEKKYGFNTMTFRLWVSDFVKSLVISTVLMLIVLGAAFWLIQWSQERWWLWIWGFFLIFSVFMMYIAPYVIEPLFNKFTPVKEEQGLEESIQRLMEKVGIHVSQVFKIDASKRSTHTNAYFTGIGKVKRIVLYDTLLKKLTHGEILTILAHEAGHWKKKHVFKRIVVSEAIALLVLYISFVALQGDLLSRLFSIHENTFFAKVVVLGFIAAITAFPFGPVSNYFSRRQEQEADVFAFQFTDDAQSMASALVKLSRDNLSNLHPHPLYALFHYSHPPVVQRIRTIQGFTDDKPA